MSDRRAIKVLGTYSVSEGRAIMASGAVALRRVRAASTTKGRPT